MDLKKLGHCVVVADLGSFSRAASQLSVPQSVLSRHVRDVERSLGVVLLHRTGRGAVPTEAGLLLIPAMRALVADGRGLLETARRLQSAPSGLVRLGILSSLTPIVLAPLLAEMSRCLPEVRLQVMEGLTEHLDQLLTSGRNDLSLLYNQRPAPQPTDEPLLRTHLCLIGGRGDPVTRPATIAFSELSRLPLTLPALPNRMRVVVEQACRRTGVALNVTTGVDSIGTLRDLAATGTTYTILPPHFVMAEVASGRLQAARIVRPTITRTVLLAMAAQAPINAAVAQTAAVVRDVFERLVATGKLPGVSARAPAGLGARTRLPASAR
jgi:LysR family nitrogen assimilation transcriptional regulator